MIKKDNIRLISVPDKPLQPSGLDLGTLPTLIASLVRIEDRAKDLSLMTEVKTSSLEDFASGSILKINRSDQIEDLTSSEQSNLTKFRPHTTKSEQ